MKHVTIYCDGSCLKNPGGTGGWGVVLSYTKADGENVIRELSGSIDKTTNNQMEIVAAIKGLEALKYQCQVEIYTDSQYVIGCASKGWKRKKNQELLSQLDELCNYHDITWNHVRGHSGNILNERCDQLAKEAAKNHFNRS
jgi:ribonuclease HI